MQLWIYFQLQVCLLMQQVAMPRSATDDCVLKSGNLNNKCIYQINNTWTPPKEEKIFTIEGNGATINCTGNSGLLLENFSRVSISQVTIKHCGVLSRDNRMAALTIASTTEVLLDSVNIVSSSGTGLSILSCVQNLTIEKSMFSNNKMANSSLDGGGGVYINQYQCKGGHYYSIYHSNFTENSATVAIRINQPNTNNHYHFGTGGGLSLNFANTTNIHVEINCAHFENNTAERGGGLHLGFEEDCVNNTVIISQSSFFDNQCSPSQEYIQQGYGSAGGGLSFRDRHKNTGNLVLITKSCFMRNAAYYGGAISAGVLAFSNVPSYQKAVIDRFIIKNTNVSENIARIGAAMDIYCAGEIASPCYLMPVLMNIDIFNNRGIYNSSRDVEKTHSTVHLEMITANVTGGNNRIADNQASGVGMDNAELIIDENAKIDIKNNMAVSGGGIAAIGMSVVILCPGSHLKITGNTATDRGGGIYSSQILNTYSLYTYTCFIKYASPTHPNNWTATVTITRNKANDNASSIFASSVYPCVWPDDAENSTKNILQTFCGWRTWKMDDNCSDSIQTLPHKFTKPEYKVRVYPMNDTKIENFNVRDDLNHTVTNSTLFSVCKSHSHVNKCIKKSKEEEVVINGHNLKMSGKPKHYLLLVQTTGFRSISTKLSATLQECPVGYSVAPQKGCQCILKDNNLPALCNDSFLILDILLGHCIGLRDDNATVVLAKCPYTITLETIKDPYVHVFIPRDNPNEEFCAKYHRYGLLCSKCKPNKGINVFSSEFNCITCNHTIQDIVKGLMSILLPQSSFIAMVIIFHVGITSPSMNAYIFFSHVSLLPVQVLLIKIAWRLSLDNNSTSLANALTEIALTPYRLWTFDYPEMLRVQSCFGQNFKIMHALAFQYLSAFFPTVLVLLTLILIELHARNCKPVVYMWRPFCYPCIRIRRTWELRTSVIDAFATVVLLSYSKVVNTSISLLRRNFVYKLENTSNQQVVDTLLDLDTATQYFKNDHIYFGLVAIIILCTFGLVPPLLLSLYPYKWFKKVISWGKLDKWHGLYAFVETFQGCYKDGTNKSPDRRWFAGMYFIFRVIIFLEYALINDLSSMFAKLTFTYVMFLLFFITVRPYKKDFYNYLDGIFLIILISVNLFIYFLINYAQQHKKIYKPFFFLAYTLLLLPTTYLVLYALYLICTRSKWLKKHCLSRFRDCHQRSYRYLAEKKLRGSLFQEDTFSVLGGELIPSTSPLDNLSEVPDRIDHPDRYSDFDQSNGTKSDTFYGAGYSKVNSESREKLL